MEPKYRPHSVRTCEPLLRAVGVARGRPRGGSLAPPSAASGFRRSPSPGCPPSGLAAGGPQRLARPHAVRPVLGLHAHTNRTRDTWVAEPRLPVPKDGRPEEGQRLTTDPPHNGGRPSPWDGPPPLPRHAAPHRAWKPWGQYWAPTPAHQRPQHVGSGPRQPAQRTGSRGRESA